VSRPLSLFIIAGEPSGDRLGAAMIAGLRQVTGGAVTLTGIGGPLMEAEGLKSLFPMDRLSVMGLAEVLPRLSEILSLIRKTAHAVGEASPDALITIDSPDFCLRVAKRARAARPGLRTVHYVAPSVWAWRPGRAAKMAKVIDHVLALLPFEPPYMTAAGMTCDFVGHPVVATQYPSTDAQQRLRESLGIPAEAPLLCLLPGSRAGEVTRHAALFAECFGRLKQRHPELHAVVPTVAARVSAVREALGEAAILIPTGTQDEARKRAAFATSTAALAVSGTVSLELAAMGTPMAVAYRANPVSVAIARRLVKIEHASLVNLIENEAVIPEYLAEAATPDSLTEALDKLLSDPAARAAQTTRFDKVMGDLGRGGDDPGLRAARSVMTAIR